MAPTARVELELEKPLDEVFEQLLSFERYGEWNPFVVKVDGAPRAVEGARVVFHVRWPGGGEEKSDELVTRVQKGADSAEVAWRFQGLLSKFGLVRSERVQRLTRLSPTRTRYFTEEIFYGLLARFVPLAKVQAGFEAQIAAMAARVQ